MSAKSRAPSIVAALPDLTTAAIFLTTWIVPTWFGPAWVMNMGLSLLNEIWLIFLIWIFCGAIWKDEGPSTPQRRWVLGVFMVLLFPVFFLFLPQYKALSLSAAMFAWLLFSRMFDIWLHSGKGVEEGRRLTTQLAFAVVTYIPLAVLASVFRLPRLGITPEFENSLNQYAGPGGWALDAKRVLAFGMTYFLIQALVKFLQAWFAAHPEASWLAPLPGEERKAALALDTEGSMNAARNLAKSGSDAAQISQELQKWRGLSPTDADKIASRALSERGH